MTTHLTWDELIASRRQWLDEVLAPWCRAAAVNDLRKAERDWPDLAGKVTPETTLWRWAWSRFPGLVHPELGIEETHPLQVTLRNGQRFHGYADQRQSRRDQLWLYGHQLHEAAVLDASNTSAALPAPRLVGPFSLDQILSIERIPHVNP